MTMCLLWAVCNCTVTEAVPDLVVSCALVAVTVTEPAAPGAVKTPAALMLPDAADHVTAELKLPVPCTVALHCDVAFAATAEGAHETATEAMEDDGGGGLLLEPPPPQAVAITSTMIASSAYKDEVFTDVWFGFSPVAGYYQACRGIQTKSKTANRCRQQA